MLELANSKFILYRENLLIRRGMIVPLIVTNTIIILYEIVLG
jgi:hypothetical protein